MKMTLTDNEGIVLGIWTIEEDFGDIHKSLPASALLEEVRNAANRSNQTPEPAIWDKQNHCWKR